MPKQQSSALHGGSISLRGLVQEGLTNVRPSLAVLCHSVLTSRSSSAPHLGTPAVPFLPDCTDNSELVSPSTSSQQHPGCPTAPGARRQQPFLSPWDRKATVCTKLTPRMLPVPQLRASSHCQGQQPLPCQRRGCPMAQQPLPSPSHTGSSPEQHSQTPRSPAWLSHSSTASLGQCRTMVAEKAPRAAKMHHRIYHTASTLTHHKALLLITTGRSHIHFPDSFSPSSLEKTASSRGTDHHFLYRAKPCMALVTVIKSAVEIIQTQNSINSKQE